MLKEMDGRTTRKYRVLDPQKAYSRGIIGARSWANNDSSWSILEIDKAEQERNIQKRLGKDIVNAFIGATTATEKLEATSLLSKGSTSRSGFIRSRCLVGETQQTSSQ